MFIEERHEEILKILRENGRISIGEIQEVFQVSQDSARRDLRILEEKGMLKRTHGGAIPLQQVGVRPPEKYTPREMPQVYENYDAIARKAVEYIKPGDIVYITSGSVGYLMTKYLRPDVPFTLVTNSIVLADTLKYCDHITIYLAGGHMRQKGVTVDTMAAQFVSKLHFDVSFMTGAGFSADFGLSNGTHETAFFQQTVLGNSRRNILLMPCQKIGFEGFIQVTPPQSFELLITDKEAVEEELTRIREEGVEVVVV